MNGGRSGVSLVIADHHSGLVAAIGEVMLGAAYQRRRVHFLRNVFGVISKDAGQMVAATIRTIFAQLGPTALRARVDTVADMLGGWFPKVKEMLVEAKGDLTAFAVFPKAPWTSSTPNSPKAPRLQPMPRTRLPVDGLHHPAGHGHEDGCRRTEKYAQACTDARAQAWDRDDSPAAVGGVASVRDLPTA
ncbi:transposase [Streptomyces sp. NPDC001351]|uniref:transposase n=1 Tax=Streptomyces sp. NPDC001351 TaxID=3364564 RepID=UPI0036BC2821